MKKKLILNPEIWIVYEFFLMNFTLKILHAENKLSYFET